MLCIYCIILFFMEYLRFYKYFSNFVTLIILKYKINGLTNIIDFKLININLRPQ